jgi:hypothetical protein
MPPHNLELPTLFPEAVILASGQPRQEQCPSSSFGVDTISIQGSQLNKEPLVICPEMYITTCIHMIRDRDQVLGWIHGHIGDAHIVN